MLQFYLTMVDGEEEKSLVESLYKEHRQLMYKTAFKYLHNNEEAEDAVHEAFLRVIKNISKFRTYSCNENVSYLVIIVRGIALNMLEKKNKITELPEDLPSSINVEEAADFSITYEQVKENIKKLSPALKNIATLLWVNRLSETEVAELLDIDLNSVRVSATRARAILRSKEEK